MGYLDYRAYLRSSKWRSKRSKLLASDSVVCECCGIEKWKYSTYKCKRCGFVFMGDRWDFVPFCENCENNDIDLFERKTSGNECFHLHHTTYKNLGNEKPDELLVLCEDCHMLAHLMIDISHGELNKKTAIEVVRKEKMRRLDYNNDGGDFIRYVSKDIGVMRRKL